MSNAWRGLQAGKYEARHDLFGSVSYPGCLELHRTKIEKKKNRRKYKKNNIDQKLKRNTSIQNKNKIHQPKIFKKYIEQK